MFLLLETGDERAFFVERPVAEGFKATSRTAKNFHFTRAAQRDSIENKQGKRVLGGVRQRVFAARHH